MIEMLNMEDLLHFMVDRECTDIHLCAGRKPHVRIFGELHETELEALKPDCIRTLVFSILNDGQIKILEQNKELDFSFMLSEVCRCRVNVYVQRGTLAMVIRAIPFKVGDFEELGIPDIAKNIITKRNGLVLVTGAQGAGKTTTLASMIDYINRTVKAHVITIEDPVEYLHRSKKSIINQREIGSDTRSYKNAMRYILRQDPDVCVIGEIRDMESVQTALTLAEAGVLVLTSLHSPTAPKAVSRVIDMFSPDYQYQVRLQLSLTLRAIFSQQLVPMKDKKGRVLACEIMTMTSAIEHMIRNSTVRQINSVLQTSKDKGMQTMDQSLFDLYSKDLISEEELMKRAVDIDQMEKWLGTYHNKVTGVER
ncbi:type IV pilus twitching motility protein PilT [Candidatus Omnitrophota bacterium]